MITCSPLNFFFQFLLNTYLSLSYSYFSINTLSKDQSLTLTNYRDISFKSIFYEHIAYASLFQMEHLQLSSFLFKFKTPSCLLLLLLITIFTVSLDQVLSIDPKFEVCAPKSCGDGTPPISYPFWIESEESYCGHPNFQITCKYGQPVLAISDDDFIIKEIYPNNTVLVVNSAAYEDTCLTDLHNFSLDHTPFHLNASQLDFFFLYNCSSEPKPGEYPNPIYAIDCASNDVNKSFAVFHVEGLQYVNYSLESCQSVVRTTVRDSLDVFTMNYTEILRMGFLLDWTAHDCNGCKASDGRCGYDNDEFVCFCKDGPQSETCKREKGHIDLERKLAVGFGAASGSIVIMLVLFYFYLRRRKRKEAAYLLSRNISSDPSSRVVDVEKSNHLGVHLFSYFELEEATNNFDSAKELGDGGFGTVYYGKLRDGRAVAVKRLYEHNFKRVEQFLNEVEILTRLRHKNLVSLYGCTSRHSRELLLVYEYVSNGTVADHLHGDRAKPGSLPLCTRLKIAVETASALSYLHASDIIHRDVKTNNILLDEHFCVKVADFGLSRLFPNNVTHVSTAPQGTPGYVDPDYHQCYQLTDKSDVYSFGVVLVELISSMPAVDITRHRHEINLSNLAIGKIQGKAVHELVDPALGYEVDGRARRAVEAVAELAFGCLQGDKDLRPSMVEVLEALRRIQSEMCDTDEVVLSPSPAGMGWSSSNDTTPNASV